MGSHFFIKTARSVWCASVLVAIVLIPTYQPANAATQANSVSPAGMRIELPARIPAQCVKNAAKRYAIPEMAMLAILKQESNGRTGVIGQNSNGSKDYGPAQFNSRSWGKYMRDKYGISLNELNHNMCQALMAQAYAIRYEWNRCIKKGNKSIWCAIAYYHSPTKKYQDIYVRNVWRKYQKMIAKGKF